MAKADNFHLITLDYLKAFCIFIVIFAHCGGIKQSAIYFPFWGTISVPVFVVITGYVFTLSANRHHVHNLLSYFYSFWWKKWARFLIPYILFLGVEIYLSDLLKNKQLVHDWHSFLVFAYRGGIKASGNYYFCVLWQIMLIFPFLASFIEKTPARISFPILVSIQILFEVWAADTLTSASYRLCGVRYLMMLAAGIYLAKGYFNTLKIIVCFMLGAAYIYLINYTTVQPKLFFEWKATSFPTALYAVAFVWGAIQINKVIGSAQYSFKFISNIGKASFHILMIQCLFFAFFHTNQKNIFIFLICFSMGYSWFYVERDVLSQLKAFCTFIRHKMTFLSNKKVAKI